MKKNFLYLLIFLLCSMSFLTSVYAGPNEHAGIVFDLDATTYGNQNVYHISPQPAGIYLRVDIYATNVHNLDTFEFEVLYDPDEFTYVSSSATNPLTFEENILTSEGGTAIGWMVNASNLGILRIAYTLTGTDTLQAPDGEGLLADLVFQTLTTTTSTLEFGTVHYFDSFSEKDTITNKGKAILFNCGFITGTITDEATGNPVENSIITAESNSYIYQDTSDVTGHYMLDMMLPDTYDVTYYAFGYSEDALSNIIVTNPDTNYINMSLLHPEIDVSISSLELSLLINSNYDTTMTISNNGNGYLEYSINVVDFPELLLDKTCNSIHSHRNITSHDQKNSHSDFSSMIKPGFEPAPIYDPIKASAEDTIHYDGEPYSTIGLRTGGEFEAAIRLTPKELSRYHGYYLIGILFKYGTGNQIGFVNVYGEGTSISPGPLVTSQEYVTDEDAWCYNEIFSPVRIIGSQEMWIGVTCSHDPEEFPMSHDKGPAVPGKSDWAKTGGIWDEMANYNMDYSWNIRAIVSSLPCSWLTTNPSYGRIEATQTQKINLMFNTFGLEDSTYESYMVIENNSSDNLINIPVTLHVDGVSVDDDPHTNDFHLQQNTPNPISLSKKQHASTMISYSIPSPERVSLSIYNIKGQLVDMIVNEEQIPGTHSIEWTPQNVSSGIYFYRLTAGDYSATKKILILK